MAILKSYYKMYRTLPEPDYFFIKNEYAGDNTLSVNLLSTSFNVGDGEYKLNDGNWTPLVYGQNNSITIPANGKVYFRATNWGKNSASGTQFSCNQNFSAGGNVMSLNDYTNVETTTMKNYLCRSMFLHQSKLLKADFTIGNVKEILMSSFSSAFYNCTNLTTIPDFSNLTSVSNFGFDSCFSKCSSLITAPDFSNITNVGDSAFQACFSDCTSLTTAPDFSNITTATPYCFSQCLRNCTSLMTAPDFSNVTTIGSNGFAYCFNGCSKLNYVYAPNITSWDTSKFSTWLAGVASYGIIRKKSSLTIPTDSASGCPANWEFENY